MGTYQEEAKELLTTAANIDIENDEQISRAEEQRRELARMAPNDLIMLIYRQMRSLAGAHRDLDDLAQTALEQVLKSRFDGRSKVTTFTHAVCYRTWLKHLRFSYRFGARFSFAKTDDVELGISEENPDSLALQHERFVRLHQALDKLSPRMRAVVSLHDLDGLHVEEIAEIVDSPCGTVRSRLRDGRKKLRQALSHDDYFSSPSQEGRN